MSKHPKKLPAQEQRKQPGREDLMTPEPDAQPDGKPAGKLADKVAYITGGDSGIGKAVALLFAQEGAKVAISYLNEHEDAEQTAIELEKLGAQYILLPGDLQDESVCRRNVERVVQELGGLNILVNNIAEQHPQEDFQKISAKQLESTFKTNIFSFFFTTQEALKHMHKGDCIINTASVTAYRGSEHLIDYSATKGAIVAFTRSLAQNLAKKGIRVNGVAPGPIWTPLIPSTFPAEQVEKFGQDTPLGRPGQPSEVAPAYLFLAQDTASYITGQFIHPNGGEVING
jgi:NAD(P)-dependent dehydrogenase (short-subunit alcohol dehydrogenase family)